MEKGDNATAVRLHSRIDELSKSRKPPPVSSALFCRWGDQSVLWPIRRETLQAEANERIRELARPKSTHQSPEYQNREVLERTSNGKVLLWQVDRRALEYQCSERIEKLSKPIHRGKHAESSKSRRSPESLFIFSSQTHNSEEIFERLSAPRPRMRFEQVLSAERHLPIQIPIEALYFQASKRLQTLATVPERRLQREDELYRDPVWKVKESALQAKVSKRLNRLAQPKALTTLQTPVQNERNHLVQRFRFHNVAELKC